MTHCRLSYAALQPCACALGHLFCSELKFRTENRKGEDVMPGQELASAHALSCRCLVSRVGKFPIPMRLFSHRLPSSPVPLCPSVCLSVPRPVAPERSWRPFWSILSGPFSPHTVGPLTSALEFFSKTAENFPKKIATRPWLVETRIRASTEVPSRGPR